MDYKALKNELFSIKDDAFAAFNKSLCNSDLEVIGIRTPIMKDYIKKHYKDEDLRLSDFEVGKYLEIDEMYYSIALKRCETASEQLAFLKKTSKHMRSWCVTDTCPQYMKDYPFSEFYKFFIETYNAKDIYTRRLAYVMAMRFRHDREVLTILNHIRENDDYMVMMGEAWMLATVAIDYPQEILDFLTNLSDATLKRKTISKIVESFRIKEEYKSKFKELRNQI